MKAIAIFALGLAIAATATVTFAQATQATQPAAGKPARHAKIDTNGDGVIDRSEAAANPKMAEHFDGLDANKDGRITAEERPQHGGKGGKGGRDAVRERMAQLDTNKDGRFSRDELAGKERALQNFAAIDANKDGFLTREEMAAHHKAHRGERSAQPQQK
jgi:Ca2+-binding EF-hand superfamily protein